LTKRISVKDSSAQVFLPQASRTGNTKGQDGDTFWLDVRSGTKTMEQKKSDMNPYQICVTGQNVDPLVGNFPVLPSPILPSTQILHNNIAAAQEQDDDVLYCPHCNLPIIIEELNCGIFRHAVYKTDPTRQVPSHSSQATCENLVTTDNVIGCCKPFLVAVRPGTHKLTIKKCEYI
jgi:hypothetical protein